jgi:hypothetical protein
MRNAIVGILLDIELQNRPWHEPFELTDNLMQDLVLLQWLTLDFDMK